jgi:hypothetical protein
VIETLAVYAGALFVGVVAASLFAVKFGFVDPEPAGCSGHHFERRGETYDYRIKTTGGYGRTQYIVEKKIRKACGHDGCSEERTEWKYVDDSKQIREAKAILADHLSPEGSD